MAVGARATTVLLSCFSDIAAWFKLPQRGSSGGDGCKKFFYPFIGGMDCVRLSLLTMTNPNQLCEVLLFVCSKMADETTFSSKLPVADRTSEVWGRKLCWWGLSSGFPLGTFLIGFADSFRCVFTSTPSYEARYFVQSCSLDSVDMLKSLREALRVSLYRFFWPPWERFPTCSSPQRIFFGKRSSGILACLS